MAGQQNPSFDWTARREEATSQDHPRHRTAGTGVGSSERVAMRNQNGTSLGGTGSGLRRCDQARLGLCYFDTDLRLPTRDSLCRLWCR